MKVDLYSAISLDGFIAKSDGDSGWVSPVDEEHFLKTAQEYGCIILGRKTFDQYQGIIYPLPGVTHFVVSSQANIKNDDPNVLYVSGSISDIETTIAQVGFEKALLVGGATTNNFFIEAKAIDEIILSVHPLILGDGLKLFGSGDLDAKLELIHQSKLDQDLILLKYKVLY